MRYQDKLVQLYLKLESNDLDLERRRIEKPEHAKRREAIKKEFKKVLAEVNKAGHPTPISQDSQALLNLEINI